MEEMKTNIYEDKKLAAKMIVRLKKHYNDSKTALKWSNPFELLIATMLSAQCTDDRVNLVTPSLFRKYPTPKSFAKALESEVRELIKSCGLYKTKAKSIITSSQLIENKFNGQVPDSMENLLLLRGVARKTANIILSSCFKKAEGIAVDTHVARLAKRFFFSLKEEPNKIEQDLMDVFDKKDWLKVNYMLVEHGRHICKAIKPECAQCFLRDCCPSFNAVQQKRPFVTVKYAQSLDGKIAAKSSDSKWISNDDARVFAHRLRVDNDAILIGINTAINDDPLLDVRLVQGRNPVRVILDSNLKISVNSKIVKTAKEIPTIIFTKSKDQAKIKKLKYIDVFPLKGLQDTLEVLAKKKIKRLLVEGGGEVISSFMREKLVDTIFVVVAPIFIGNDGIPAIGNLNVTKVKASIKLNKVNEYSFADNSLFRLNLR